MNTIRNMTTETFSLRFRKPGLRSRVAEVAASEGLSQNEFLEQAAEHEVITRGGLVEQDLQEAAAVLSSVTREARKDLIERSIWQAAAGEGFPDPISGKHFTEEDRATQAEIDGFEFSGVTAAFYNAS